MVIALGLLPLSKQSRDDQEKLKASASPYASRGSASPWYEWTKNGDMSIATWDSTFDKQLAKWADLRAKYKSRGLNLDPWNIFKVIPKKQKKSDSLFWNQGNRPSCAAHGSAHAYECATIMAIALGAPLIYDAVNPIYSFYLARGGNYNGGVDLITMYREVNSNGFYPVSVAGTDNITIKDSILNQQKEEAKKHQAGIIPIEGRPDELVDKIFRACRGLCSICFGSGIFYSSATKDSNGVKVMTSRQSGGHAQAFTAWKEVNGTEYIFNINSHGPNYTGDSSPDFGAWITKDILATYAKDMSQYGDPWVVFPEGETIKNDSFVNTFTLPKEEKAYS